MSKRSVAKTQSWGFAAAVIGLVGYFAVFNPTALSPTWVTVIGLLLTAIKTLLGLKTENGSDDQPKTPS